jgi:hypothetical protein
MARLKINPIHPKEPKPPKPLNPQHPENQPIMLGTPFLVKRSLKSVPLWYERILAALYKGVLTLIYGFGKEIRKGGRLIRWGRNHNPTLIISSNTRRAFDRLLEIAQYMSEERR